MNKSTINPKSKPNNVDQPMDQPDLGVYTPNDHKSRSTSFAKQRSCVDFKFETVGNDGLLYRFGLINGRIGVFLKISDKTYRLIKYISRSQANTIYKKHKCALLNS